MKMKTELSFLIYDVPDPNVSIDRRHRSVVQGMRNLQSPFSWRDIEAPETPVREKGAISALYKIRYPSIPVFHTGSYQIRDAKYLYDKAACDDRFSFEFKPGLPGLDYANLLYQSFAELVSAIGGYRAVLFYDSYSIQFDDRHAEIRKKLRDDKAIDTDGRNNIFCLDPVHYWSEELCQKAFGFGRDEVIRRLTGKVPLVKPLMDGVYVVFSDNPDLTFEDYCAYNDALKPVLGLI